MTSATPDASPEQGARSRAAARTAPRPAGEGTARRGAIKAHGTDLLLGTGTVVVLVLLWDVAERTRLLNPSVIPGPAAVVRALGAGFGIGAATSPFSADLVQTLFRLLAGFFAGTLIGLAVGVVAGTSRAIRDFLDPLVATANVIPAVITLPVIALWTGVGTETIILVTAYSTVIPIYRGAIEEIKGADRTLTWAAHSLGAQGPRYVRSVIMPLTAIGAVRNLRLALGYAWRAGIAAEILVVAQQGLGSLTFNAHQFGNIATMLAALITILVVGLVLDLAAVSLQGRVLHHRGLIGK